MTIKNKVKVTFLWKKWGLLLAFLLISFNQFACDVCGCGIGGNYLGIIPNFSQNLWGISYQSQTFQHPQTHLNLNNGNLVQEDVFHRTELWTRQYVHPRVQVFAFLPYQLHQRMDEGQSTEISGIGDIRAMALYSIINTGDSTQSQWKHTWQMGAGVKLPTGKYQQRDDQRQMLPLLFQIGNGAYGWSFHQVYTLRYKSFGMNTELQYRFNGTNELNYQQGDQFMGRLNLFYWKNFDGFRLLPSLGLLFEHFDQDMAFDQVEKNTGGLTYLANAGLDVYSGNWMFQLFAQKALHNDLAYGMPESNWRLGVGLGYFFGN